MASISWNIGLLKAVNNKKGEGCGLSWQLLEFHPFPFSLLML